jgi:endoglucanase
MKLLLPASLLLPLALLASPGLTTQFIKIDQFGYRPGDQKIAVIANPISGYNNGTSFSPGSTYEVRDWVSDAVVFTGTLTAWNGGATQAQSGDKAWWFDFSSLTTPGAYYIYDLANNVGSYRFEIDDCVYQAALKQAMRFYYYQRCGVAKQVPYTAAGWADAACHTGTQQDTDCRLYNNTNVSTSKNLSGGWHDAGDYNKYVNFTWNPMCDLLLAYEENPAMWTDDYNIPESGDGIPDLLDELKFELDWLLKMQQGDGSVLSVIGGSSASPPSADGAARRYGPATTSASLSAAGIFALAAMQYTAASQASFAATLQTAAINAWNWANANPGITFYNAGTLAAGEQELGTYETSARKFAAAVYLYALTGNTTYRTYVDNNYASMHLLQWTFAYPFEGSEQDALLYYTKTPGATTPVRNAILNAYTVSLSTNNADNLPAYNNSTDAYRAWLSDNNYTWNSNQTKSKQGIMFLNMNVYNLDATNAAKYTNAASGFVHYFHGVNPNTKTYLSNMGSYGAENSVTQFYHAWFEHGSALWDEVGVSTYGPPPGYIPGGPNPGYALDGCCPNGCGSAQNNALCNTNVTPPLNQPIQKSYKDFNDSWPINSWTVTEAGIYTNAAYIRMLSHFSSLSCSTTTAVEPVKGAGAFLLALYPQPAREQITIRFAGNEKRALQYVISDVNGHALASGHASCSGTLDIQTDKLTAGVYFLKVVCGEGVAVRRFVIG